MIDCIRNREAEDLKAGLECHVHFYIYFPLHLLPIDFEGMLELPIDFEGMPDRGTHPSLVTSFSLKKLAFIKKLSLM
jgi:hypothetical protein